MDYLALCRDAARESGTLAGGVGAILTLQGVLPPRVDKIASWVSKAWRNIQNERNDWLWMRREFTAPLVAGKARYAAGDLGLTRVSQWANDASWVMPFSLWNPSIGLADEGVIRQVPYEAWRRRYQIGTADANRPTEYAIAPNGDLCIGTTPDRLYMLRGAYRATPQSLVADTDVPEMPEQYHDLIVWEALRLLAESDEAQQATINSLTEGTRLKFALERDQLPAIEDGTWAIA